MANQEIPLTGGDAIINAVSGQWGVASVLVVLDETNATQSISVSDVVSLFGSVVVLDGVINSESISNIDTVTIPVVLFIDDSTDSTLSLSLNDNVTIGEFLFSVNSKTNINGVYYSTNING